MNDEELLDSTEWVTLPPEDLFPLTGEVEGATKAAIRTEVHKDRTTHHRVLFRLANGTRLDIKIPMEKP